MTDLMVDEGEEDVPKLSAADVQSLPERARGQG